MRLVFLNTEYEFSSMLDYIENLVKSPIFSKLTGNRYGFYDEKVKTPGGTVMRLAK